MSPNDIRSALLSMQDADYREFMAGVVPTIPRERIIGIRTPVLKMRATELYRSSGYDGFLEALPHYYFEENQLHAFLISKIRDMTVCMERTEAFLPFVDNWATCDQLSPAVFAKDTDELLSRIPAWLGSGMTYTVRFGIDMLMRHFLDERFDPSYPGLVLPAAGDEYYINMAVAWYFATALAKQYESVISYITEERLPAWVHNKTIQKAVESRRITEEKKEYLRTLRRRVH